jgi:hypothetical protein
MESYEGSRRYEGRKVMTEVLVRMEGYEGWKVMKDGRIGRVEKVGRKEGYDSRKVM